MWYNQISHNLSCCTCIDIVTFRLYSRERPNYMGKCLNTSEAQDKAMQRHNQQTTSQSLL